VNDFWTWLAALASVVGFGAVAVAIANPGDGDIPDPDDEDPEREDDPPADIPGVPDRGFELVRQTAQLFVDYAGAPEWFADMCLVQAASESGGNPLVGLGVPETFPKSYRGQALQPNLRASRRLQEGETNAARRLYENERNRAYRQSPFDASAWTFGSGGLYGLLPATGLSFARRDPGFAALKAGELSPLDVFDPVRSTAMYANFVRYIVRTKAFGRLPRSERTVYAIKRGGAALSLISDWQDTKERSQKIRANMSKRIRSSGADRGFAATVLAGSDWSEWPGTYQAIQLVEAEVVS